MSIIFVALLRPFAHKINLIDSPNLRKKHKGSIPLIGGLSMFLAFIVGVFFISIKSNTIYYFIFASSILVLIGAIDDHRDIAIRYRIFFQILAALIVVFIGDISIVSLGYLFSSKHEFLLHSTAPFFTILVIIIGINALNMSDGIHGLAGLISFITFLSLGYFSYINANFESLIISVLMCAVILPFLFYNLNLGRLPEKRIFMGDAGSMFLGIGIVWLLVDLSQGQPKSFSPITALWLFSFPLIDAASTVIRRIMSGKSPIKPDLNHLHHILLRYGLSSKLVLLYILLFSIFMSSIGIYGEIMKIPDTKMFLLYLFIFIFYFVLKTFLISKKF